MKNPMKLEYVTTEYTSISEQPTLVEIESTKWYNTETHGPGQPGVFEVNTVKQFDSEDSPRRFSYFNGKQFGPISSTPEGAFRERFNHSVLSAGITRFRGLKEPV